MIPDHASLVGILNITPDSFSDGGETLEGPVAISRGIELFRQGASIVDIGGDSTRPGSVCCGAEIEWTRIASVVRALSTRGEISVDTHHVNTAERAIDSGATLINSVFESSDAAMFSLLSGTKIRLAIMYSRCSAPHEFGSQCVSGVGLVQAIFSNLERRLNLAIQAGLTPEQLILDPGMGAFLSSDPADSWLVLEHFFEFAKLGCPLMLACSRKGFLRQPGETDPSARDLRSAEVAHDVLQSLPAPANLLIRAHNVGLHCEYLRRAAHGVA